jgi:chorismate synthase
MSPAPGATKDPLTQVRPGHADLAGMQKYGFTDARDVLERASARETAARVAAGALAKKLLSHLGVEIISHVIQMGGRVAGGQSPGRARRPRTGRRVASALLRRGGAAEAMVEEIKAAAKDGDSLGGVVEVLGYGVPVGLGSHVHWDRKLDALLAQALMSIQAVKGVEIGDGFEVAGRRGSAGPRPDPVGRRGRGVPPPQHARRRHRGRHDHRRAARRARRDEAARHAQPCRRSKTVDTATKESTVSFKERTDVTAVPAMGVVAETMVALVLARRRSASSAATRSRVRAQRTPRAHCSACGPNAKRCTVRSPTRSCPSTSAASSEVVEAVLR